MDTHKCLIKYNSEHPVITVKYNDYKIDSTPKSQFLEHLTYRNKVK